MITIFLQQWGPEAWGALLGVITGLITAIAGLIPVIIKLVQTFKELVKNKNWTKILAIADSAIEAAEKSGRAGSEKKQIVIDAVKAGCEEAGITLDPALLENLSEYIDEAVTWFNDMKDASQKGKKAAKLLDKGE